MNLYLVQHAEAKSKDEDPDRPLTDKGQSDIKKVANYVAQHGALQVGQILHSGKTRARQTAEVLAGALKGSGQVDQDDDLGATDEPSIWANRLSDSREDVILVGHMPHLSKLAALLVCGDEEGQAVDFQNGGVVCLTQDEDTWAVSWVVTPQIVR
jgi:phosphohistidine phosphatase